MIYLENDFYSNFNSMVDSNDDLALRSMFIDQISNLIAYKKNDLINLFEKIGIKVSKNPTNKELSKIIATNIKGNKKLQIGIAYLIAENNNILQQEIKKSRPNDNVLESFNGTEENKDETTNTQKPKRTFNWGKSADAVTSVASAISVFADTLTQVKKGQFENDLNSQSNVKSPEELAKEEQAKKEAEAKKKRRNRNIIIAVVVVALGVTAFVGYKKGWFSKKVN
jgi:hypothetical protein